MNIVVVGVYTNSILRNLIQFIHAGDKGFSFYTHTLFRIEKRKKERKDFSFMYQYLHYTEARTRLAIKSI